MQIQLLHSEQLKTRLWLSVLSGVCTLALLATILAGCDRSDQSIRAQEESAHQETAFGDSSLTSQGKDRGHLVKTSKQAESIIADCVQTYRSLRSYQDSAAVELHYLLDGQATVDKAPMNVAWDQSGKLGLRVYSLIAGPTQSGRWRLRYDSRRVDWDGQVLSRFLPDKLDFNWLLSEPTVREELAAGLAGFPPQLDLLLSPEPLAGLLQNATSISLGSNVTVDGQPCWRIIVELKQLVYQLYIDQHSKILRRIQLPTQNLPPEILQDSRVTDLQLIVDFQQIQTNHSIAWSGFEVPVNPGDWEVDRFVSRPPQVNLDGYGKSTPAFQLREPNGQIGYDSRPQSQRKASVLIWLADHSSCQIAAQQLTRALQTLQQEGVTSEQIEIVSVWAEPQAPDGLSFDQLQSEWQLPGKLVLDKEAAGRDLFQIEEAPTLIILDSKGSLQLRDVRTNPLLDIALPALVSRIANGENLALEIQAAQKSAEKRFQAELTMASVTEHQQPQDVELTDYPPGKVQLTETGRQSYRAKLKFLLQDAHETPWVLLADGSLNRLGTSLTVEKSYQTSWGHSTDQHVQIVPSYDGRLFAHFAIDKSNKTRSIQILDSKTGHETLCSLPDGCQVVDMCWLGPTSDFARDSIPVNSVKRFPVSNSTQFKKSTSESSCRLAVITDSQQLILFDWETQERYSGDCPQTPVALLDHAQAVVLRDGTVEPIELDASDERNSRNLPGEKQALPFSKGEKTLPFQPLVGPWVTASTATEWQLLGTGQITKSEPALFFVNPQLAVIGHYRLPAKFESASWNIRLAHAISPGSGELVWAILESNGTVHLVRGDSGWSDHFRIGDHTVGVCLVAAGDRLKLLLASRESVVSYQLD